MRPALKRQRGFSLLETLVALVLFMLVLSGLLAQQRGIMKGLQQQWQYRTLWRLANQQVEIAPPAPPDGYRLERQQQPRNDCLIITATLTSPDRQQAQLSRWHCPLPKR